MCVLCDDKKKKYMLLSMHLIIVFIVSLNYVAQLCIRHTILYSIYLVFNISTYLLLLYFSCIAVCCMLGALEKVLLKYIIHSLRVFKSYPVDSSNSCGQISSCKVCRASATADAASWLGKYCKYGSPSSIDNSQKYCVK